MAINFQQLKQKTQQGNGFNAPGAAEKLQFLQNFFERASDAATKDPAHNSLNTSLAMHAQAFKLLTGKDIATAEGEQAKPYGNALQYLIGFKKYLHSKNSWEPHTPYEYLMSLCKDEQEKAQLEDSLKTLDDILELGVYKEAPKKEEEPKVEEHQEEAIPEQGQEAGPEDGPEEPQEVPAAEEAPKAATPEEYLTMLQTAARNAQAVDDDGGPLFQELHTCLAKMVALKHRPYGAFDSKKLDETAEQYADLPFFTRAFQEMSSAELKALIAAGDADAVEKIVVKELMKNSSVLETTDWWEIAPNARDFTKAIQDKIGKEDFLAQDEENQIEMYKKILAARTCVHAERGSFRGGALNKEMDLGIYRKAMEEMEGEEDQTAIESALSSMIGREGAQKVADWARDGHGGLLEDKIKTEVRNLAKEGACQLKRMPERYRPTVKERLSDIQEIMKDDGKWNGLEEEKKKFLISEYALLQKDARMPGGMDAKLGDIQEHNAEADAFAKSQRFNESVQNIDQVRRNLATLNMNEVAEGFRKSQIEEIKQKQAEGPVKGNEEPNVINGLNL